MKLHTAVQGYLLERDIDAADVTVRDFKAPGLSPLSVDDEELAAWLRSEGLWLYEREASNAGSE